MPVPFTDITGFRVGMVSVVGCEPPVKGRRRRAICRCDCGKTFRAAPSAITHGRYRSCGCARTKHGMWKTAEFECWSSMKKRCLNPRHKSYADYGGRGITVCDRWIESFNNFYADMGPRPGEGYSIERTDNDGPYSPENCKWATVTEQALNKRQISRKLTPDQVRDIRHYAAYVKQPELASMFGVASSLISAIVNRKKWRKV